MLDRTVRILAWYREEYSEGDAEPPARPADIAEAEVLCQELTGQPLPAALADLWRITDGFDCNGHSLFGVRERQEPSFNWGFLEVNQELEKLTDYLWIGSAGDEKIALHLPSGRVDFVDLWSREPRRMFRDLDELVYGLIPAGIED